MRSLVLFFILCLRAGKTAQDLVRLISGLGYEQKPAPYPTE